MTTEGPWYGIDLDGTIAHYDHWRGPTHIGEPVPKMLARVKAMLARGQRVKIFTARVSMRQPEEVLLVENVIKEWCQKHLDQALEVTCKKDFSMIGLFDDRAIQIIPNTGERVDGLE